MQKGALKYFERSMEIVKTSNFQYAEGLILQRYGLHGLYQNDLDLTLTCEQKSIYIFKQIGELWEVQTSLILSVLGRTMTGDLTGALNELLEVKNLSLKVDSKMQLGWAYGRIAYLDYLMGNRDYSSIKNEIEESLSLAKETGDLSGSSTTYMLHANVLTLEGNHENALEMAHKAYSEILKYKIKMPHILYGFVYICETALEAIRCDSYLPKKRAIKLYRQSYRRLKQGSKQFKYLRGSALRLIALMSNLQGNNQKAKMEISLALKSLKSSPNRYDYAIALMNASQIFSDDNYSVEAKAIFDACNVKRFII
jgi:hypothetical protein